MRSTHLCKRPQHELSPSGGCVYLCGGAGKGGLRQKMPS